MLFANKSEDRTLRFARGTFRRDLSKTLGLLIAGAFVGYLFGSALAGYALTLTVLAISHIRHLAVLRRWLKTPKKVELPEPEGIWSDIFQRLLDLQKSNRKRKKRLALILAEFQASTAALPDGAVVLGTNGEINWYNKSAQLLLGLRGQSDIGIRIPNLIRHPDFADYFSAGDYSREVEVPSPANRSKMLALRVIPYGNGQRLLIARDVSELRRLDVARRDFVSNASHELRTPLTVLRGYLDLIEQDSQSESGALSEWNGPVTEMRNQATRMESLISDMLKLAKLESETDSPQKMLDIPEILERVVEEAKAVSKGVHELLLDVDSGLFLFGGEVEIQSVFTNLVTNAVRYTPDGGRIRVRWFATDEGACLAVSDTGIGISANDIPRLTERFYRVDVGRSREGGGTGLGLSIVKHALARHDAYLEIDSELGAGSTFSCLFPSHRIHSAQETPEQRAIAG